MTSPNTMIRQIDVLCVLFDFKSVLLHSKILNTQNKMITTDQLKDVLEREIALRRYL